MQSPFILLRVVIAVLLIQLSVLSYSQDETGGDLPLDVQLDLLMTELTRLNNLDDQQGILDVIGQLRALDVEIPDALNFLEARALYHTGEALAARDRLVAYLARTGRDGRYYDQATELLLSVREQAAIEEREKTERERRRAQELAEAAEKARVLRIREAQRVLSQIGFRRAQETGEFDKPTREALAVYQIRHDLQVNGDVTEETMQHLRQAIPETHNCDGLAKYARMPDEWSMNVGQIPAEVAVPECNNALRDYPEVIRFQIQYARALFAAGRATDAMTAVEFASKQGYPAANMLIGMMYESGAFSENDKADYVEALEWYRLAAEEEYPEALVKVGDYHESGQARVTRSSSAATSMYQKAAILGYPPAQVLMGDRRGAGRGAQRNYEIAFEWYQQAAEAGYPPGEYNLGYMYERGRGVEKNRETAITWYKKAREKGYARAIEKLRNMRL